MKTPRHRILCPIASNLLIWAIVSGTVVLLCSSLFSARVHAQAGNLPCMPPAYAPVRVIELVSRIPQSEPRELPRGTFAENTTSIFLAGNEIVCLASSSDGHGMLLVDDQLEFEVVHADASLGTWRHDFYDPVTRGITSTLSQDVSRLFAGGLNGIRITLRDFFPNYYSSAPIWLIIWRGPTPTATATPTITGSPTPTNTPTGTPTFTSTPTNTPTITPTSTPTDTDTFIATRTPSSAISGASGDKFSIPMFPQGHLIALLLLASLGLLLLAYRRLKTGFTSITDTERLEKGSKKSIERYAKDVAEIYRSRGGNVDNQYKDLADILKVYNKGGIFSIAAIEAAKQIMQSHSGTGLTSLEIFEYLTRKGILWDKS